MEEKKEFNAIGVLTSGGDAPGMNAAIRAVVREALANKVKVKGIMRGYKGLLNEEIFEMKSVDVANIIQRGGTILGTARCLEFKELEVQKHAAEICRKHGIDGFLQIFFYIINRIRHGRQHSHGRDRQSQGHFLLP